MANKQQQFTKIVLDVAGPWRARDAVVAAIAAHSPGWKFAGRLLVHTATHRTYHLDVLDRDGALGSSAAMRFRYEPPKENTGVETPHLWLRFTAPAGTFDMARLALDAVVGLVAAGASGVECVSSGGALAAAELATLSAETGGRPLARAFTAVHDGAGGRFTSGMQSLGLADVIAEAGADGALEKLALDLVDAAVKPKAGARYGDAKLAHEMVPDVGREDPRFNPFGRWRLSPWTT